MKKETSPLTPLQIREGKKTKAFTLVELIVMIIILAILGIITFISLQGYSKDSRDVKRISDVRSILSKLNVKQSLGIPLDELIINTTERQGQILGEENTPFQTMGRVDFTKLNEKREDFQDPKNGKDYYFAYAKGGTGSGGYNFIQGATVSETSNTTKILGHYYTKETNDIPSLFTKDGNIYYEKGKTPIYDVGTGNDNEDEGGIILPPPVIPSCDETTKPTDNGNIIYTEGTPIEENESWQNTDSNNACYYTCKPNYTGTNCSEEILNGACNTTNTPIATAPTTENLCTSGISTTPQDNTTIWTWTCEGANGGTTANCIRPKAYCNTTIPTGVGIEATTIGIPTEENQSWQNTDSNNACYYTCKENYTGTNCNNEIVNGMCGTANNTNSKTKPTTNLCANGTTASAISGTGPWTWTCAGLNGGVTSATCRTNLTVDGVCGTSNNTNSKTKPTTNLCANGTTASTVLGTGPWTWTCVGLNGGTTSAICTTNLMIDGMCGTSNNTNSKTKPTTNLCANGTTASAISGTGPWTWTCAGFNGGTTSTTCTTNLMIDGTCGTSNGTIMSSSPSTDAQKCSAGTVGTVTTNALTYTWNCTGINGGTTSNCTTTRTATCGTSNGTNIASVPSTDAQKCGIGTSGTITTNATTYTWNCTNGTSTVNCKANRQLAGVCGNGGGTTAISTKPTTNLCTTGTNTTVTNKTDTWTWTCRGTNGGTTITCSRPRAYCNTTIPSGVGINTTTIGTPTNTNQSWQNTDSNNACYYTCKTNYSGNNCVTYNNPVTITYSGTDIIIKENGVIKYTLMDRNLGATSNNYTLTTSRGNHYQWGRNDTGFTIGNPDSGLTWSEKAKGPCPVNYHVPSILEWDSLVKLWYSYRNGSCTGSYCSLGSGETTIANLQSDLKLPFTGRRNRNDGSVHSQEYNGLYWSSSPDGTDAHTLSFYSSYMLWQYPTYRANGLGVRCFKN